MLIIFTALIGGSSRAQACSGISGAPGGYISGGCNDGPARPAAPPTSRSNGGGGTVYRNSGGGGGFSPGAVGTAAGAAAAILGGLGRGQPSHDGADCDALLRQQNAAENEWGEYGMRNAFASKPNKCQAARDYYQATSRKFDAKETWLFACNGSYTTNAVGRVDSSNFYSVRQHDLAQAQQDANKACHQTAGLWDRCEEMIGNKDYSNAKFCFVDMREVAVVEGNQKAIDRADFFADWYEKHEKTQARLAAAHACDEKLDGGAYADARVCYQGLKTDELTRDDPLVLKYADQSLAEIGRRERVAAKKVCEDQVEAKEYGKAKACYQTLKGKIPASEDPDLVKRADYIIDWVTTHQKKMALAAAQAVCESSVAAKAFAAARTCFQQLRASDIGRDNAELQARADAIIQWAQRSEAATSAAQAKAAADALAANAQKQYGSANPYGPGGNPFAGDTPSQVTRPAEFDGPAGHLYSTTTEENVYGTGFYRDGTTKRP